MPRGLTVKSLLPNLCRRLETTQNSCPTFGKGWMYTRLVICIRLANQMTFESESTLANLCLTVQLPMSICSAIPVQRSAFRCISKHTSLHFKGYFSTKYIVLLLKYCTSFEVYLKCNEVHFQCK